MLNDPKDFKTFMILSQIASDVRVPKSAIGYVADLQCNHSEEIRKDRLAMLRKYVPELVAELEVI